MDMTLVDAIIDEMYKMGKKGGFPISVIDYMAKDVRAIGFAPISTFDSPEQIAACSLLMGFSSGAKGQLERDIEKQAHGDVLG